MAYNINEALQTAIAARDNVCERFLGYDVDLNDYNYIGVWLCPGDSRAYTYKNMPPSAKNMSFRLINIAMVDDGYIGQYLLNYISGNIFYRLYTNGSGFSKWYKLTNATTDE